MDIRPEFMGVEMIILLNNSMAEYMGFRAIMYFVHSSSSSDKGYITGLIKNKAWIRNGIMYRKSLYFTFNAASKEPAPKVDMHVINKLRGPIKKKEKIFIGML